jgi:serine/threonine protein kinase
MIANKYEIKEDIKKGAFGTISKGIHVRKGELVAIKREYGDLQTLKHEVKIMNYLATSKVKQIPEIFYYGSFENHPCLVFTLYECSLYDYMRHKEIAIEHMNILMIKMLNIFINIHKAYVVHRDIKPQNFMIKNGDIFLIDFGLATFFVDETGSHYANRESDTIVGTPLFVSIHIHKGSRYCCRDDLISLGYLYLYMTEHAFWIPESQDFSSDLPLTSLKHPYNMELDKNKSYENMRRGLSQSSHTKSIYKYMDYVYSLDYGETPKYIPLQHVFYSGSEGTTLEMVST